MARLTKHRHFAASERLGTCAALAALALLAACRGWAPPALAPSALPFALDSMRTEIVRDGVAYRYLYSPRGPWAIFVLEADATRCWAPAVLKAGPDAESRATTSALLRDAAAGREVAGAVNAGFFLFAPPGVPQSTHVAAGRVIAGPGAPEALVVDSSGVVRILALASRGWAAARGDSLAVEGWNHRTPGGLALFDDRWRWSTDSMTGALEAVLEGPAPYRVRWTDRAPAGVPIPPDGAVLVAGPRSSGTVRAWLGALRPGDTVRAAVTLVPIHPLQAVAGRGVLVRDGEIVPHSDTVGRAGFGGARHPRTAVGIGAGGTRLLLVVVDGRRPAYSDGMTLPELAQLMHALGARDALNLDGGGSSTMVIARRAASGATDSIVVVNSPSDREGEREVGDALAIVRGCEGR